MKITEGDKEGGLKIHKTNCDMLYRWSMWRMYLNEELSRVISAKRDHLDQSNSIYNVTSPYIRHPDGKKYGNQMKKILKRNIRDAHPANILSDNVYLVYGLPRVSLRKRVPDEVHQLHESLHELEMNYRRRESDGSLGADEQINRLFDFVTADEIHNDDPMFFGHLSPKIHSDPQVSEPSAVTKYSEFDNNQVNIETKQENTQTNSNSDGDKAELYHTKSEKDVPLASKSRLFWERLAGKKSEIIEMAKQNPETKDNHEHVVISSEILQKQQKLLKKTVPKRTSKDLWRTLRERKTEILQMREMASSSGQNNEKGNHIANEDKKHESKTSHLWGFIFHKKKETPAPKRGRRMSHDVTKILRDIGRKSSHPGPSDTNSNISPRNFEDSFQKELAERLRKRRIHLEPASTSEVIE